MYSLKYNLKWKFNGPGIRIIGNGGITVGAGGYVSRGSQIVLEEGCTVNIGKNVTIGHHVMIYTSGRDALTHIQGFSKIRKGNVVIEDNVTIGTGVFISPGVTVGANSFIGANVSVSRNIPSNSILSVAIKQQSL